MTCVHNGSRQRCNKSCLIPNCLDRHKSKKNRQHITDQVQNRRSLVRRQPGLTGLCFYYYVRPRSGTKAYTELEEQQCLNVDKYQSSATRCPHNNKKERTYTALRFFYVLLNTFKVLFCYI